MMNPAEELEARKQDSVWDGADESELPPDDEPYDDEDWPYQAEDDEFEFERRAREGYVP